jgi:predicted metal-dependent phosphoesterase TrpH
VGEGSDRRGRKIEASCIEKPDTLPPGEGNGKALKADFHLHTREDPQDPILHDAKRLIDRAQEKGFEVLSITNHESITYSNELQDYACQRGILLLPGLEATIEGRHVLIIAPTKPPQEIRTFSDVKHCREEGSLIIAPHPYLPGSHSLQSDLDRYIEAFDAIEFSHFYNHKINFNPQASEKAKKWCLPLVGTSDTHMLWQLGTTYSRVWAEKKEMGEIVSAVKDGRISVVTRPLRSWESAWVYLRLWLAE